MDLETTMVDMSRGITAHKERVVVDTVVVAVDVRKKCDIFFSRGCRRVVNVEEITRYEVEMSSVEGKLGRKVLDTKAEVTELYCSTDVQILAWQLKHVVLASLRGCGEKGRGWQSRKTEESTPYAPRRAHAGIFEMCSHGACPPRSCRSASLAMARPWLASAQKPD